MKKFDLDTSLAAWRGFISTEFSISEDDADELESHLRDHFDDLIEDGLAPELAFEQAIAKMGSYALLTEDYKKSYWKKMRSERRLRSSIMVRLSLLQSYYRISIRQILRQPVFTFINVLGLGIGLAGCILIAMYVLHELSYDRFHERAGDIYRLVQETEDGSTAKTAGAHAALVEAHVAGTEMTGRVIPWKRTITVNDPVSDTPAVFEEPDFVYADQQIIEMFSFALVAGDPESVLEGPGKAVITEKTAQKYFGDADPVGRVVMMYDGYSTPNQIPLEITGVLAELAGPSHLTLSVLASTATIENQYGPLTNLEWPGTFTYALFSGEIDVAQAAETVSAELDHRIGESGLRFQQLSGIYLNPQQRGEAGPRGSKVMTGSVALMAVLVLLLACANFTNLTLARARGRIRELGVRKSMGAGRRQIFGQYIIDTMLLTCVAVAVAVAIMWLCRPLPVFLTGKSIPFEWSAGLVVLILSLPQRTNRGSCKCTQRGTRRKCRFNEKQC